MYQFISRIVKLFLLFSLSDPQCNLILLVMSSLQPADRISCYLKPRCTGVECCLDVSDPLDQTLKFSMNLDLCNQILEISVEKLVEKKNLFFYSYGNVICMP